MAAYPVYQLRGLNLKINPLDLAEGELIRAVNVDSNPILAKSKRPGYITYLGTTPNGSVVDDLMNWTRNNGTQFWNYAYAGGLLYYSTQGTGAWTISGNGTFSAVGTLTSAVLEDTLYVGDGVGTLNFSTTGTSFVNAGTNLYNGTSTTPAPIAVSLLEYHQRIFAAGTASNIFWSNVGTGTDWTNDSSSVLVPGAGKLLSTFKSNDRLIATKNSGAVYRYDEFNLQDSATNLGPTSSRSVGNLEDYRIYLNRQGFFGYGGNKPELLSNPIESQIYNNLGSGIIGTTFDNAPGVAHQYKYYCSIGTVTDDLTDETVSNAVAVYDFQLNEWTNYTFANRPTSWLSYKDPSGNQQLLFGGGSQVYQIAGTATSDNGNAIESAIEGVIHYGAPQTDKRWNYLRAFFNPGCEANIQVALTDTFTKAQKQWLTLGDAKDGVVEYKFKPNQNSKLLFYKITDASINTGYSFYGFACDANLEEKR